MVNFILYIAYYMNKTLDKLQCLQHNFIIKEFNFIKWNWSEIIFVLDALQDWVHHWANKILL